MISTDTLITQLGALGGEDAGSPLRSGGPLPHELRPLAGDGRKARTRAAILAGVEALIGPDDPYAIKARDIANQSGVSVGSLYVHFSKKADLPLTLAFERACPLIADLHAARDQLSAAQRILALGDLIAALSTRSPAAARALATTRARLDAFIEDGGETAPHARAFVGWLDELERDVHEAQVERDLRTGLAAGTLAASINALWYGLAVTNCEPGQSRAAAAESWAAACDYLFEPSARAAPGRWRPPLASAAVTPP